MWRKLVAVPGLLVLSIAWLAFMVAAEAVERMGEALDVWKDGRRL